MSEANKYPKEQIVFLQAVFDMRIAQRAYYAQPSQYRLKEAKGKEQRVDTLLQQYINAGVPVVEKRIIEPAKLFD